MAISHDSSLWYWSSCCTSDIFSQWNDLLRPQCLELQNIITYWDIKVIQSCRRLHSSHSLIYNAENPFAIQPSPSLPPPCFWPCHIMELCHLVIYNWTTFVLYGAATCLWWVSSHLWMLISSTVPDWLWQYHSGTAEADLTAAPILPLYGTKTTHHPPSKSAAEEETYS